MSGLELFESLVQSTGLPPEYASSRLQRLLSEKGFAAESLQVEQVREVLSELLLDVINESAS